MTGEKYSDSEDETQGAVYEVTPWRFAPLRATGDGKGSFEQPVPQQVDLWCPGSDSAFLIKNLLSPEECDEIIAQAESFGMQSCGYSERIRITDRVSVRGGRLGRVLFERARPFLKDVFIPAFRKGPEGCPEDMLRGLWQPSELNPCFRVCRYSPGGFFAPHYDGGFDTCDRHRSIKTFMIYLNDDFEGGPTSFYNENQRRYSRGLSENQIYELRPEKGSCLVFNHCITHDGGELLQGKKYILRTEVMYRHRSAFDAPCPATSGDDSDSSFENERHGIDDSWP
eukprot:TRINITY_DN11380_c0_g2_i1.p1 TRINITY_DN11380_c0_g2~~TRINITY_DN11380_c0_g2_i1.p1  ORF type:complete len:324 (+),score=38.82 TRINITY_DN11380_c0_g2_i1:125-973(+)